MFKYNPGGFSYVKLPYNVELILHIVLYKKRHTDY